MSLPNGPYKPSDYEKQILENWLTKKYYKPEYDPRTDEVKTKSEMETDDRDSWCLVCPPPNAYGRPHIGNISGYAYMDAMARFQRMNGKKVLMLPGKDHAGLEGEGVYVREVLDKKGINKFDLGREKFYEMIMQYNIENMETALKDEKEIGLSADFDRNTFTLDPDIVETVLDTFVEMYKQGMIYKGVRLINWDPKARTAVADNQVEYKDAVTPFFYFKYSFPQPEQAALDLKKQFEGKRVEWIKKDHTLVDNDEISYLIGTVKNSEQSIIALGYEKVPAGTELVGDAYGIQMRLDNNFKLVVINPDFEGEINELVFKAFQDGAKLLAGVHILSFEEHANEKFYTNGFVIGTVRPETIFADTAIACDPSDARYKAFVEKQVEVEFLGKKKLLHFIEDYAVDKDFGTGLLKVTPAHSPEDWEIAQRHPNECLPPIQVIGYDLKLNSLCGEKYDGMRAKDAREMMREDMKLHGNLVCIDETYQNRIQIAERTKAPIEPLLSSQWYLKYDGIKEAAIQMVQNAHHNNTNLQKDEAYAPDHAGKEDFAVTIHPENMVAKFNNWMENLRDWAISRSLWWGYRLPVWYHGEVKEEIGKDGQVQEYIKIGAGTSNGLSQEWTPLEYENPDHLRVQKASPGEGWIQDEDVLDTWFSSAQWPYATLMKYDLLKQFFPSNLLVSGFDILENWDSRMMMFSYFKTGKAPFKELYLTGLVKGTDGQKMSKSRGNLINIDKVREEYGTDAVRMAFFYQNKAGGDYAVTEDKLRNFRNFNNKLWNASKFVLMNAPEENSNLEIINSNLELKESNQLIEHIQNLKEKITQNILDLEYGYATESLYEEFWHSFCDKDIEEMKKYFYPQKNESGEIIREPKAEEKEEAGRVLLYVLREYLKMLHPFIPFITEVIWQEVPKVSGDHLSLLYSKW